MIKNRFEQQDRKEPVENSTRQRIVAGARAHFFVHGFRSVTMDDLAQELGMSKKTLYANFPSKTALLEAVLADKFRRADSDLKQVTSSGMPDIVSTMQQLLGCLQRHAQEIQPPFVRDIHRLAPEMFKSIQNRRRALVEKHFGKALTKGRRKGIIRGDIPTWLMIEILLGTIDSIMNPTKIVEIELTPKTALSTILAIFFHGVMVQPNRAKL